ncbi:MAG: DNA gyrase C-terminal beta-propeller domain-containing protein, partial [Paracoccaceae bacterium]|nr:DNA gyrase C-terminal beta-propeller domain-containing protein [Paracoccaceae bacterium]
SMGKAIRFPVTDVRLFKGRDSSGVRGIKLNPEDYVVSMAILNHVNASSDERTAYFKMRKSSLGDVNDIEQIGSVEIQPTIPDHRFKELLEREEWILMITSSGFGKRSSAHEYRIASRGGQGISAANLQTRDDTVISSFPVDDDDQIMLVTSTGQSIRCPVDGIRLSGRSTAGVTVFKTAENEKVVSVALIAEKPDPETET